MSELVSTPEVAKMLGISRAAVTRRVTAGTLTPAFKMPGDTGAYLFHREDIEALAEMAS
jgi:excisionase family DNA binding protein